MTRAQILAAAAALVVLPLGGCSAEDLAERAVERSIENAGGEGAEVDFDAGTGEFKVETDEGTFSSGGDIPDSFPSDDIPLLDGKVIQAISSAQDGSDEHMVSLLVDESPEDAFAEAVERLTDAGFVVEGEAAMMGTMNMRELVKDPYRVTLSVLDAGESGEMAGTPVTYIVAME